jgi:hypothetical protein
LLLIFFLIAILILVFLSFAALGEEFPKKSQVVDGGGVGVVHGNTSRKSARDAKEDKKPDFSAERDRSREGSR